MGSDNVNEQRVVIKFYTLLGKSNVAEHFGISYGTAQDIMSNKLGMRRVSARWVPRLLLPEQMVIRVKMCNEYCRQYNDEVDTFLNRVVTCDETWIHFFEPVSKQHSSVWKHPSSPSPTKALISKSAGKVMAVIFYDIHGIMLIPAGIWCQNDVVLTSMRRDDVASTLIRRHFHTKCPLGSHFVPPKTTITGNYYATVIKSELLPAIKRKRPLLERSGILLHHDKWTLSTNYRYRTLAAPPVPSIFSDL